MADPGQRAVALPLACSLPERETMPRIERWRRLADRSLIGQEATAGGIRQRYRGEPAVRDELEELARLERDCCGWAEWSVTAEDDAVVLAVTAEGDGAAAVRSMFGLAA